MRWNQSTASKVEVKDEEGELTDAWAVVSWFGTILNEEEYDGYESPDPAASNEIRNIFRNLVKQEVGSVKVLGPAGSGKTTLIKQMVAEIISGKAPVELQNTAYILVDSAALSTGTKNLGTDETKINAMLELSRNYPIVWIIDEVHTLKGKGTHSQNPNDMPERSISTIFRTPLSTAKLRCARR